MNAWISISANSPIFNNFPLVTGPSIALHRNEVPSDSDGLNGKLFSEPVWPAGDEDPHTGIGRSWENHHSLQATSGRGKEPLLIRC